MAENSKIEWTDHTFNPWRGCVHKQLADGSPHPGCENCYAEAMSKRNPGTLGVWGEAGTRVLAAPQQWALVNKWNEAAAAAGRIDRVFCASLADVFEDWEGPMLAPGKQPVILAKSGRASDGSDRMTMDDARAKLFELIDATPHLFWLLLTKRPENVRRMMPHVSWNACDSGDCPHEYWHDCDTEDQRKFRHNVAIGTSVSDQATADELVPKLLDCRDLAPVLFLSVEPLVGPVDLTRLDNFGGERYDALRAEVVTVGRNRFRTSDTAPLDWVIVGGESGHHARPMHPQWARDVRDQCTAAGVPFFFKQWGEWVPSDEAKIPDAVPTKFFAGTPDEFVAMKRPSQAITIVRPAGGNRIFNADGTFSGEAPQRGDEWMTRVGKHDAGRLLDGQTWSELPAAFTPAEAAR